MLSNEMYVLEGGGPDILQQALREVSADEDPVLRRRPLLPKIAVPDKILLPPSNAKKAEKEPLGSSENPIQLIQRGSTFHALQPLNDAQLSEIARVLNNKTSNRVVYKVVYPEDVDLQSSNRRYPQNSLGRGGRRRGRPRRGEEVSRPLNPEARAKKLKNQFGLSEAQVNQVKIDDDDDDRELDHNDEAQLVSEDEEHVLSTGSGPLTKKRTRSGRVSRPPQHVAENFKIDSSEKPATAENPPRPEPDISHNAASVERPKRQFRIPGKYRCRVCNKIYLGNRKMLKHMKLFPNHGPCEDAVASKAPPPNNGNNLHVPIIPMARNQLEDLVKYLDAELVLDVVSKKMFDNFSLWELVAKKMMSSGKKGTPLVESFLSEIESFLSQVKKLFDHCFTATKLGDKKASLCVTGELTQAALNVSEGPWYLEEPDHIPSEFQKILGYGRRRRNGSAGNNLFVSPRSSDSLDDNNSLNSNISNNEKDSSICSSISSHSLGAQMVLETNLGAVRIEDDEEDESCSSPKKRARLDSEDEEDEEVSPIKRLVEEELEEEDIMEEEEEEEEDDVDPKKVLEQNGINISSNSNDEVIGDHHHSHPADDKVINVSTSELALEIESLVPFPPPPPPPPPPSKTLSTATATTSSSSTAEAAPLPSFSSFIAEKNPSPAEEDLLCLAAGLEASSSNVTSNTATLTLATSSSPPPPTPNVPQTVEEIMNRRDSPLVAPSSSSSEPIDQPLSVVVHGVLIESSDAKLSTSTNVTFNNQQPIFSLSPSSKTMVQPPTNPAPPNNSNSFLNDLSSVLLGNEPDTNDFGFPGSALNHCNNSLKTPEKLLRSIPPASMMKKKEPVEVTRTNFLGALSSSVSSSPSSPVPTPSSACTPATTAAYEAPPLITSALVDVTQPASMRVEEAEHQHPSRDSLSSLFDEVQSANGNIFPPNGDSI